MTTTTDITGTTAVPATTFEHIAPARIKAHPKNPRQGVGDISDILDSIPTLGIVEPLIVAPPPADLKVRMGSAEYVLIAGHRRLAAAVKAKLTEVPVLVRHDLDTTAKQVEAMLVENLARTDLSPVEEADAYQLVLDLAGITQAELAKRVGQPAKRISERLKLTRLPEQVRAQVHTHQLTITDAVAVATIKDPKVQAALVKKAGTSNFRYDLTRAQDDQKAAADLDAQIGRLTKAGITVGKKKPEGFKDLAQLFEKYPRWSKETERASWVLKNHKDCPGAAAYTEKAQYSSRVDLFLGCTQPKLHPVKKSTKSKAELAAEKNERDKRAARNARLTASATTRREHLRLVAAAPDRTLTDETLRSLLARAAARAVLSDRWSVAKHQLEQITLLCNVMGVTPPQVEQGGAEKVPPGRAQLAEVLAALSLPRLAVATHLAMYFHADHQYLDSGNARYDSVREWLDALSNEYGYQWSDDEVDLHTFTEWSSEYGATVTFDVYGNATVDGKPAVKPGAQGEAEADADGVDE